MYDISLLLDSVKYGLQFCMYRLSCIVHCLIYESYMMCACAAEKQEWCLWGTDSGWSSEAGQEMCLSEAVSHAQDHRRTVPRKTSQILLRIASFFTAVTAAAVTNMAVIVFGFHRTWHFTFCDDMNLNWQLICVQFSCPHGLLKDYGSCFKSSSILYRLIKFQWFFFLLSVHIVLCV